MISCTFIRWLILNGNFKIGCVICFFSYSLFIDCVEINFALRLFLFERYAGFFCKKLKILRSIIKRWLKLSSDKIFGLIFWWLRWLGSSATQRRLSRFKIVAWIKIIVSSLLLNKILGWGGWWTRRHRFLPFSMHLSLRKKLLFDTSLNSMIWSWWHSYSVDLFDYNSKLIKKLT